MKAEHEKHHRDLVTAMAKLEASRRELKRTREEAVGRAEEQLDSMPRAIDVMERAQLADKAGGIMGHRALSTLHTERDRLQEVVAHHRRRPA